MPGLFGILSKKPGFSRDELKSMGLRMARSMRTVPWLKAEIWADDSFCGGRVHLGVLNSFPQPLIESIAKQEVIRVWFDGQIYPEHGNKGVTPAAEEVVELIRNPNALSRVEGVFTTVCFNPITRVLSIANDRLGFRPLYFIETGEFFAYAAEVKALLAIASERPKLDEISLKQFFSFDYILGERTWWKGVELVPPASAWNISAEGRQSTTYWTFDDIHRDLRPEAEVLSEFQKLWSREVEHRSMPGTMPLLLSGGLDSRLLLAELCVQGRDLVTITFGEPDCHDMNIARRCARLAGVPHRPIVLNSDNWWNGRDAAIWQTDGLVNAAHYHGALAVDEMRTGNCYTLINSTGDTLFGGSRLNGNENGRDWAEPRDLLSDIYLENQLFSREEVIEASLADCKRYLRGPSSDCFTISQRQRRMILAGPLYIAPYCEVVNPGISSDCLQLFLGCLSNGARQDSKFYNRFLVNSYPEFFSRIRWQKTGRGLKEPAWTKLARDFKDYGTSKLGEFATSFSHAIPGIWRLANKTSKAFADYEKYVRENSLRETLSRQDLVVDEYFQGTIREAIISQALDTRVLLAIVTFEIYLRQTNGLASLRLGHLQKAA